MRILLVEDEQDLENAIKKALIQHHYVVDVVEGTIVLSTFR